MEYTDIRYSDITNVYWFCECQSSTTGGRMVSKWIVWGEQSHAYIIKHPIETQLTPCDGIHWHQVQWHYYLYWFCECQSWRTGGRMVSKWIVWGRAVSCYIISTQLKHNWLLVMEYTDIRYSDITTCKLGSVWVARDSNNWRTDASQTIIVWRESSLHAYIIQAPNWNSELTPCDGIHWHQRTVDIPTCIDSVSASRAAPNWGTDGPSKWIVWGRAVSCLHNQAPNWNTIDFLWWNTAHIHGTVTFTTCIDSVSARCWRTGGTDGLQMKLVVEGEQFPCLP